jgi:hypothetical protein
MQQLGVNCTVTDWMLHVLAVVVISTTGNCTQAILATQPVAKGSSKPAAWLPCHAGGHAQSRVE